MKAVGYIRVSSEMQVEQCHCLDMQRQHRRLRQEQISRK